MLVGQKVMNIHASRAASSAGVHTAAGDLSSKQSIVVSVTVSELKMSLLTGSRRKHGLVLRVTLRYIGRNWDNFLNVYPK